MYDALKHSHMLFITISIVLFNYRFILKTLNKPVIKIFKIIPHINDTLLLVTAISMTIIAGLNPLQHHWLLAKIIALFVYIGLGTMALKASGIKSYIGYILAISTFVFIVFSAINKMPFTFGI